MVRFCLPSLTLVIAGFVSAQEFGGSVRVVDGDTLDLGGMRVCLHGIDAPELGQHCTCPDGVRWDCGTWVAAHVRAWIGAREVTCKPVDTDRYGRVVARCDVQGHDIGRQLVRDGLAVAYRKYSMAYDPDEKAAEAAQRGLHGHGMRRPAAYRNDQRTRTAQISGPDDPTCTIKGNVSRAGT